MATMVNEVDILKLFCDYQSYIKLAINLKILDQNKHIFGACHHSTKESVEDKEMSLHYTITTTLWQNQ